VECLLKAGGGGGRGGWPAHMALLVLAHMASISSLCGNSMVDRSMSCGGGILARWRHQVIARSSSGLPPCKISSGRSHKQVVLLHQLPLLLNLLMELLLLLRIQQRPILLKKPRLLLSTMLQLLSPKLAPFLQLIICGESMLLLMLPV